MAPWRYVIADYQGRSLGEPRARERAFTAGVSQTATASFRIRADDPLWETITSGESFLKVYDSGDNLRFYGPVVNDEEDGKGQGTDTRVTCADMSWILGKRLIGKDTAGVGRVFSSATDSGLIAHTILNEVNDTAGVDGGGPTGVTAGNRETFVARTITYLWRPVLSAITELGSIAGSYEWSLRYTDGTPPTVLLDLVLRMGTDQTHNIFLEYGTGKSNCRTYRRNRTIELKATRVWVGGAGTSTVANAYDSGAETLGRYESYITYGDITSQALLDALATAHVAARKAPRQIVELTPMPKLSPRYGVDYVLGDSVQARVLVRNRVRVSGAVRVWGVSVTIDDLGTETATFNLLPTT